MVSPSARQTFALDIRLWGVASDNQGFHSDNDVPKGAGWNDYALIVFDDATWNTTDGSLFYYGDNIPTVVPTPETVLPTRQFYGLDRWVERFDIALVNNDDSLTVRAVGAQGIRQSALALLDTSDALADLADKVAVVTKETVPTVEVGDTIVVNTGDTTASPPTAFPATGRLTVVGLTEVSGGKNQVILCQIA